MKPPTLVLDLDNTLIYAHSSFDLDSDFEVAGILEDGPPFLVLKRPGVDDFLQKLSRVYDVVIFSNAQEGYVNEIVDHLDPARELISRRLHGGDCEVRSDVKVKILNAHFGEDDLQRIVWVDDIPSNFPDNEDDGFQILKYEGSKQDSELAKLLPFLLALSEQSDFKSHIREWKLAN